MSKWFELWDSDSANLIGSYSTEMDALRVLHKALAVDGPPAFAGLVLTEEDDVSEEPKVIAAGADLVRYVERTFSLIAS
jgi:hypothetical protein